VFERFGPRILQAVKRDLTNLKFQISNLTLEVAFGVHSIQIAAPRPFLIVRKLLSAACWLRIPVKELLNMAPAKHPLITSTPEILGGTPVFSGARAATNSHRVFGRGEVHRRIPRGLSYRLS
jgi:hypothetical protein